MLTLKPNTEYHEIHHPNTAAGMLLHAGTSTSSVETRYGTGETITASNHVHRIMKLIPHTPD